MYKLKDKIFKIFGDEGAETLRNYFTQIHYTAFWCIRMLDQDEGINAVLPEVVQDILILRDNLCELHQVKTRIEGQTSWTNADILPIICKLYNGRNAFPEHKNYRFYFVSDHKADNSTSTKNGGFGSLFKLKIFLAAIQEGQILKVGEQNALEELQNILCPKIIEGLSNYGEKIELQEALNLLYCTNIETDSNLLRDCELRNIDELNNLLVKVFPGQPSHSNTQLKEIYFRIIELILNRILKTETVVERYIYKEDITNCLLSNQTMPQGYPNLAKLPGRTKLEKKTLHGGFDPTELTVITRQKIRATVLIRQYRSLGTFHKIQNLIDYIIELQLDTRDKICRQDEVVEKPGPVILRTLKPELSDIAAQVIPEDKKIDKLICLGLLWEETEACNIWWHHYSQINVEVSFEDS